MVLPKISSGIAKVVCILLIMEKTVPRGFNERVITFTLFREYLTIKHLYQSLSPIRIHLEIEYR
jgi:hypothetical protein